MADPIIHTNQDLKEKWIKNFQTAPEQLKKMAQVNGLISAFNANIDAVIKISGEKIEELVVANGLDEVRLFDEGERQIRIKEDVVRGIIHCFRAGIAEEWLIGDEHIYNWLIEEMGYDKLQMGGQGGIVANVMAVCGVDPVYVHCASLPENQAGLFLDRENLKTVDQEGILRKAYSIDRQGDIPLIHWIIEFDKGDSISIAGRTIICPKSNRFIATYDPLNFKLHIDEDFSKAMSSRHDQIEIIILSGYQMLQETLRDGRPGKERVDASLLTIKKWRSKRPAQLVHLEMASTQDKVMRKYLLDTLARRVDSLGFNERELIDLLEVMGENELVAQCARNTNSSNLFEGMIKLFSYTRVPRLQLHMYGLYLTLQKRDFTIRAEENRNGMQLAAIIAASKAGTGAIDSEEVLLWAKDKSVSDYGLDELKRLSEYIGKKFGENELPEQGIWVGEEFELIAVPTILIDKPVTLVGMGDTISSISLVAAR